MNFSLNQRIRIKTKQFVIAFSVHDLIVLMCDDESHIAYSRVEIENLYLSGELSLTNGPVPTAGAAFEITYRMLSPNQKQELAQKQPLVNAFLNNSISRGQMAVEIISKVSAQVGLHPPPGESTVRNLVTKYKKSNYDRFSLLDSRKKIPSCMEK